MAICVREVSSYRLLEAVAQHLSLRPEPLSDPLPDLARLREFELVVAEESAAIPIQKRIEMLDRERGEFGPAVVAVRAQEVWSADSTMESPLEHSVILLPQDPSAVLAQLSVVLYAHRSFTRRYGSSMQELQLNRRIFSSLSTGVSLTSATLPDSPLVYVNPAFEMMTGYNLEEIVGRNCRFLQGQERDQPGLAVLRESIAAGSQATVVLKNFRKNGSCFWNEVSIAPIRNPDGVITHFVGLQSDVTSRVEFESALRESEKLAAVGRLAASIAHEINNPLESVMNLLFLAQHATDLQEAQDYIAQADAEVKRVALITTQSLRFYKQNSKPHRLQMHEVLDSVLALYDTKLRRFSIHVHRSYRDVPDLVCMESEIRQVLSNLVRNAIDAMRPKGGVLSVRIRPATDWRNGQKGVAVSVGDDGVGIPDDAMRKLYTAFFTTKGDTGTGLGLWVTRNIVQRHGGHLTVRSSTRQHRHGTVFNLFVPLPTEAEYAAATPLT